MEFLPKDPFLEYLPDTLQEVRKEFNLHQPGVMADLVKNFEDWIQKQPHFKKKNFTKGFLEASIILSKGSLEKAKKTLDKLCTMRTLIPHFFSKYNVKTDILDLRDIAVQVLLRKPTSDHYRTYFVKVLSTDITAQMWPDFYRTIMLMCEYRKARDYTKGFCAIIDVRNVNVVSLAMKINPFDLQNLFSIMLEGYGLRVKALHFISESKSVDALVSVVKQMVSEKIGKRIHVHRNLESLYKEFEQESLPKDYGGNDKTLIEIYEELFDVLSTKENVEYFKDIFSSGTNEAFRDSAAYNNDILGMPGSFRSLTVD